MVLGIILAQVQPDISVPLQIKLPVEQGNPVGAVVFGVFFVIAIVCWMFRNNGNDGNDDKKK
jgi:hypothetical protein